MSTRMRRLLLSIACIFATIATRAQLVTSQDLMSLKYQYFGTQSFKSIAKNLAEHMTLDENRAISYMKIVEIPGRTEEELFDIAKRWVASTFNGSDCDIRLVDREMGSIIAQGYVPHVATTETLNHDYSVNLRPVLTIDVKEGRARITFTLSSYSISNTGITSGFLNPNTHSEENWSVASHFPFTKYASNSKTSAKACVMTHLCATVFIKQAEQVLKEGMSTIKREREDW